jgi:hypothetical protein
MEGRDISPARTGKLPRGVERGVTGERFWIRLRPTAVYAVVGAPTVLFIGFTYAFEAGRFLPASDSVLLAACGLALLLITATLGFRQTLTITLQDIHAAYSFCGARLWDVRLEGDDAVRVDPQDGIVSDSVVLHGNGKSIRLVCLHGDSVPDIVTIVRSAIASRTRSDFSTDDSTSKDQP